MIGLFSGSFDPITKGHVDIIKRASGFVDKLIVTVFNNELKESMFDIDVRIKFVKLALSHIKNVEIMSSSGMVVDFVREHNIDKIYRGFRDNSDYEYELDMTTYNYENCGVMTYLIPSHDKYNSTSSTIARGCIASGVGMEQVLPVSVIEELRRMSK